MAPIGCCFYCCNINNIFLQQLGVFIMTNTNYIEIVDNSLSTQIILASSTLKQKLNLMLKDFSITLEQWSVLYNIFRIDGKYQKELADILNKDKPTITRIIDNLETKSLIKRTKHPEDRRKFLIEITKEGHELLKEIIPVLADFFKKQESAFSKEDIQITKTILKKISE